MKGLWLPLPLLREAKTRNCLAVVGAGFSCNAELPKGQEVPTWPKLGLSLAQDLRDCSETDPMKVASMYQKEYGRVPLAERLFELLHVGVAKPGPAHRSFCRCPFNLVATTNFDLLLEGAYRDEKKACHPRVRTEQLTLRTPGVALVKLHGDVENPDRLVITQEDYSSFHDRYPAFEDWLTLNLTLKTPLFLGYSLKDPDFQAVWEIVGQRYKELKRPGYALLVEPEQAQVDFYETKGVKVVELPGSRNRYGEILAEALDQISEYCSKDAEDDQPHQAAVVHVPVLEAAGSMNAPTVSVGKGERIGPVRTSLCLYYSDMVGDARAFMATTLGCLGVFPASWGNLLRPREPMARQDFVETLRVALNIDLHGTLSRPSENITYAEVVTFLIKAVGGHEAQVPAGHSPYNFLFYAVDHGFSGTVDVGFANMPATRAEIAEMLSNTMNTNQRSLPGGSEVPNSAALAGRTITGVLSTLDLQHGWVSLDGRQYPLANRLNLVLGNPQSTETILGCVASAACLDKSGKVFSLSLALA